MSCSSVCWCVCVFVCESFAQVKSWWKSKIKKITFIDFDVCNLSATLPVLYSVTLTYLFKIKYFKRQNPENCESYRKMPKYEVIEGDICHRIWPFRMLYSMTFRYIFKVKLSNWLFWQVISRKMQTFLLPSDRKSDICNRLSSLRMLSITTLTYIMKVTKFEIWISRKRWELTKNAQVWLLHRLIFAIECDHCECYTPWPWPNFSRLNISNETISELVS